MTEKVDDVAARVSIHEAVCGERYAGINARLKRLEMLIWAANGGLIATLVTLATRHI